MQALQLEGVKTLPHFNATREDLLIFSRHPKFCEGGLQDVRASLHLIASDPLLIKPDSDGASVGVMRIDTADDLRLYADAVACRWPDIPASNLPGACYFCSNQSSDVQLVCDKAASVRCCWFRGAAVHQVVVFVHLAACDRVKDMRSCLDAFKVLLCLHHVCTCAHFEHRHVYLQARNTRCGCQPPTATTSSSSLTLRQTMCSLSQATMAAPQRSPATLSPATVSSHSPC